MSATIALCIVSVTVLILVLFVVGFYGLYFHVLISLNEPVPFEGKQHQLLLNQDLDALKKKMLN